MNDAETFQQFLKTEVTQSPVLTVVVNLFLAALLSLWIGRAYVRYGTSLSNRRAFAHNFALLTMTTMLIITMIQSNVALSLGMIGALSIVRFRSAIKEPEELCYLFLSIAVGLGLGANQRLVTLGGLAAILFIVWLRHRFGGQSASDQSLFLTVSTNHPQKLTVETIQESLRTACDKHRLKRLDQSKEATEACFVVEPKATDSLTALERALRDHDDSVQVSLLDFRGGMMGTP